MKKKKRNGNQVPTQLDNNKTSDKRMIFNFYIQFIPTLFFLLYKKKTCVYKSG